MKIEIIDSRYKLKTSDFLKLEKLVGSTIHESYIDFITKHNGGYPSHEVFTYYRNGIAYDSILQRFLDLADDSDSSIYKYIDIFTGRIPKDFIPIGYDPGGNLILMKNFGDDNGAIFFWDHEGEADEGDTNNLFFVSNNISEFLSDLHDFAG